MNKFEVAHEKGKPLEEGQMYFVINKGPEGRDKAFSKYINVTEAINVFKGLKGNAELALGTKATDAQRLVTMEQGKVAYVDKDFNRTYRTPPINQTFYVERGKGYTAEQASNLIQGRAVYRNDMVSTAGVQYKAWITLNFDKPKDRFNNFLLNQYSDPAYGFDLSKVLDKFDIKELADAPKRETIDRSIRNGNRPIVTVKKDGEETKVKKVMIIR
ncbi:MAG: hypothetical protein EOP48_31475 [Sphingobacteriales bacterium]|nr:MAG: hypothetical protein EOP48_31475 [Sphingobacteriales bacterium]